jgi:hypothetical protein
VHLARCVQPDRVAAQQDPDLLADRPADRCEPRRIDTRINPERVKRNHVRQLEALGYKVTLEPAA